MRTYFKQPKMSVRKVFLTLLFCLVASAQAQPTSDTKVLKNKNVKAEDKVAVGGYPYVNLEMLQASGTHSKTGIGLDAFIPIVDIGQKLFFSNIKLNDYSNKTFAGGLYFGYRQLLPEEQKLYGVYTALDFKKTENNNYLKQITLGAEYWLHQWFFGYKIFSPIGNSENSYEKALPGVGAEIGYEFCKKSIVYVEGYYLNTFHSSNNVPGVKVKLRQKLFSKEVNSGVLDQVNLDVGVQKDKLIGNRVFAEIGFKIGASSNNLTPDGVAAHMTDTISRSRIFTENRSETGDGKKSKILTAECYYWKDTGTLATDGSSSSCPASYDSATAKNSGMTLISEVQDREFNGVTLEIPY